MSVAIKITVHAFAVLLIAEPLVGQVPQLINYQARIAVGGVNFDGTGQFKFAFVDQDGTSTYWSNDGSSSGGSEPAHAVTLIVNKGLYSVLLGDATLPNMTIVPASVFTHQSVYLRTWFDDGVNGSQLLAPDQRIAAVGYALVAAQAQTVPDAAITASKIAPAAVGSAQLADDAVTSSAILDRTIREADISLSARSTLDASDGSPASALKLDSVGRVGVQTTGGIAVPLQVEGGTTLSAAGGGYFQIGSSAGSNLAMSTNQIQARAIGGNVRTLFLNDSGGNIIVGNSGDSRVGIGLNAPDTPLHIVGGSDASLADGGLAQFGPTASSNIVLDNNEIMARNNGSTSSLFLNNDGGNVVIGSGSLGVGTQTPEARISVEGVGGFDDVPLINLSEDSNLEFAFMGNFAGFGASGNALKLMTAWTDPAMTWLGSGATGIMTDSPQSSLHIAAQSLEVDSNDTSEDDLILEATDAVAGLYSSAGGAWGSGIALKEMDKGNLVSTWGIARRTNSGGNSLRFTYGTQASFAQNPVMLEIASDGNLGIRAVTRKYSLSPYHFAEHSSTVAIRSLAGSLFVATVDTGINGTHSARSGINLPHGASLTRFAAHVHDDSNTDVFVRLFRASHEEFSDSPELLAEVRTTSISRDTTIQTTDFAVAEIDNGSWGYFVEMQWGQVTSHADIRLYGVTIEYTVTAPLP